MNRRAIACLDLAPADVGLADGDVSRQVLDDDITSATTTTMSTYQQSPDDLSTAFDIPPLSWDGTLGVTLHCPNFEPSH
jgi:hypothetical protein